MWETLSKLAVACVRQNHQALSNLIIPAKQGKGFWVLLLSSLSPYSRSKKNPMRILPPPGPHLLTPMALSTEPNSNSPRSTFWHRWDRLHSRPRQLILVTAYWAGHFQVHILGFIDVQSQGIYPNIGETGIDICLTDNRFPSRRVPTTHWRWFKCPRLGTRHARDWVEQRRLVRNLWESREPSKFHLERREFRAHSDPLL